MSEYAIKASWEGGLYTDPKRVVEVGIYSEKVSAIIANNPYASNYGRKIPTRNFVMYRTSEKEGQKIHPRRVWVMNYGNSGSAYIFIQGKEVFLDSDTEWRIQGMINEGKSFA